MSFNKSRCAGYTLIEIILVVALVMAASLAVSSAALQGVKLFTRIGVNGQERQAALLMERFTRDVQSMVMFSNVPFQLSDDRVVFARMKNNPLGGSRDVVQVSYIFDTEKRTVTREERTFANSSQNEQTRSIVMLNVLTDFEFEKEGDLYRNPRVIGLEISYQSYFGVKSLRRKWMVPTSWTP